MSSDLRSEIVRQVSRVRRRIFARELLRRLIVATAVVLLLATACLLVEPYLSTKLEPPVRWWALGGATAAAWLVAGLLALRKRPDETRSALWLDEAFALRERTVTAWTLDETLKATPAGQAVMEDALARVRQV